MFKSSELPFELNVFGFMPNARALKADRSVSYPLVDGFYLQPLERNRKNAELTRPVAT